MTTEQLWVLSHGIGGVAFLAVTMLLIATAPARGWLRLLTLACGANALWCFLLMTAPALTFSGPTLDVVEALRDCAWLAVVVGLPASGSRTGGVAARLSRTLVLPILLIGFLAWRASSMTAFGPVTFNHSYIFACGATAMSFYGMVVLEQIYRCASESVRWGFKYLCLAIGALFLYDFLMYSYALLTSHIGMGVWIARGTANALVTPLIALSALRASTWAPRLRVSHRAAFQTGVLTFGGAYLLIMAIGSYYIRTFGGDWGQVSAVVFLTAASLVLVVLLLSGRVRAFARVQINKNFFHYKYDYREEWLALTQRLSQSLEVHDPYERAIRAVAQLLESPAGALWVNRSHQFVCAGQWNMPEASDLVEPADSAFAEFLRERQWIVDFDQYQATPEHYDALTLPDWIPDIRRPGLIVPLYVERDLLGFMLLAQAKTTTTLTWEDLDLLKTIGRQVGVFLDQQESTQALAQSRQFEAVNRLTAFLMHDLKNIAAQQSLLVQNAQRHRHNPEFIDDMIQTVESSVTRLKNLLAQLQRATSAADNTRHVAVDSAVAAVVDALAGTTPAPSLTGSANRAVVSVDPDKFAMVITHIVRNAQDATGNSGTVNVHMEGRGAVVHIRISDNGLGMTPAFIRESLFRPFFTTKSTRGMGIGAYQARDFARAAGGDVAVESEPGQGTAFTLMLPTIAEAPVYGTLDATRTEPT